MDKFYSRTRSPCADSNRISGQASGKKGKSGWLLLTGMRLVFAECLPVSGTTGKKTTPGPQDFAARCQVPLSTPITNFGRQLRHVWKRVQDTIKRLCRSRQLVPALLNFLCSARTNRYSGLFIEQAFIGETAIIFQLPVNPMSWGKNETASFRWDALERSTYADLSGVIISMHTRHHTRHSLGSNKNLLLELYNL